MNEHVRDYVRFVLDNSQISGQVLEVGSCDFNGNVNDLFADRKRFPKHIHVDMIHGKNVDSVMDADDLQFKDESIDCLVCLDMLEHDRTPWLSIREFYRVLKQKGHLILTTCDIGFPLHMEPSDYWRFTVYGVETLLHDCGFHIVNLRQSENQEVFSVAVKPYREKKRRWYLR